MPEGQCARLRLPFLHGIHGDVWQIVNQKGRALKPVLTRAFLFLPAIALLFFTYRQFDRSTPVFHKTIENDQSNTPSEPVPAAHPQDWRSLFPRKIWQAYFRPANVYKPKFQIDSAQLANAGSWIAHNPDYEYVLVSDDGAQDFVRKHYQTNPTLLSLFTDLKNTGMKADLIRYLILWVEGGVYSDIDTRAHQPIDRWVPPLYQKDARVVVGVEFDRLDGNDWIEVHPDMQFCQWTMAATPGHRVFRRMIDQAIAGLERFASERNTTFAEIEVTGNDVMQLTGPAAWTDVIFQQLREYDPELRSLRDLSGLKEPILIGDILILPIDAFGMGQAHSGSTSDGTVPKDALVQHFFWGSWRKHGD